MTTRNVAAMEPSLVFEYLRLDHSTTRYLTRWTVATCRRKLLALKPHKCSCSKRTEFGVIFDKQIKLSYGDWDSNCSPTIRKQAYFELVAHRRGYFAVIQTRLTQHLLHHLIIEQQKITLQKSNTRAQNRSQTARCQKLKAAVDEGSSPPLEKIRET